ncbi:MAG TPA: spermidine synthase [Candidatus Limnocylindria bacterium]
MLRATRDALRRDSVQLVLTSTTLLFTELLVLRWIPANVIYIGFFANYLLMASFLGIGLGILVGRRYATPGLSPFPGLILIVVGLVAHEKLDVQFRASNEIFFGLAESHSADANFIVLPLMFVLVMALLATLALPLGGLLRSQPPLRAYALDIGGSIVGIALFALLSALSLPPPIWFGLLAVLFLGLTLRHRSTGRSLANAALLVVAVAAVTVGGAQSGDLWSPYYRITVQDQPGANTTILVNGIPHQELHRVADASGERFYEQVYRWFPGRTFGSALVVGAGSGTDVAYAIAHGIRRVDAVEIDPRILEIGVARHPDRPYADPAVRTHVNDGRAFLRTSPDRYDLIVFALPDSLTLVSTSANLRLESYLFTEEAFASARDHLAPGGAFVLYNYYRQPWLLEKIAGMLEHVFGTPPFVRSYGGASGSAAVLVSGARPEVADGAAVATARSADPGMPGPATDDWPFLYLHEHAIDPNYIAALAFVILTTLVATGLAAGASRTPLSAFSPHFFVLGAAFLLLETRSLATFGLLFGTTWVVNALVFVAILCSVLLAILVNARYRPRPSWLYAALALALAVAYLLPPASLLIDPPAVRYLLAATVAFAPVFVANLVFTTSFRDTRSADMAFASNLIGATAGGILEYAALVTGYRGLLVIVALLYAAAWLFGAQLRLLGDRGMAPALILER